MGRSASTELNRAILLMRVSQIAEATAAANRGCNLINQLVARNRTVAAWSENSRRCLALRAELAAGSGNPDEARQIARQLLDTARAESQSASPKDPFSLSQAYKLAGDISWQTGDRTNAMAQWKSGLSAWPKSVAETPTHLFQRSEMLRGIGQRGAATQIASQLTAMGYRQSISNRVKL